MPVEQYTPVAGDIAVTESFDSAKPYHYSIFDSDEWNDAGNHEKLPLPHSHLYLYTKDDTKYYRMNPLPAINVTVQQLQGQIADCNDWLTPHDRLELTKILHPLNALEERVRNGDFLAVVDAKSTEE
jgi:hypothetical protein